MAGAGFHFAAKARDEAADGDDARDGAVVPQVRAATDPAPSCASPMAAGGEGILAATLTTASTSRVAAIAWNRHSGTLPRPCSPRGAWSAQQQSLVLPGEVKARRAAGGHWLSGQEVIDGGLVEGELPAIWAAGHGAFLVEFH
jgi:hypothetical protein